MESLIEIVKLFDFERVEGVPTSRTSVLELLSLRRLEENQELISCRQRVREAGGSDAVGLEER